MKSLYRPRIPTRQVGQGSDIERKRRSFDSRFVLGFVAGGLTVAASVFATTPGGQDVIATIADGLPGHHPSRFDISQCTLDFARKLPTDHRYSARFAHIFDLSIDTIGNDADMYPAACKQTISEQQRRDGARIGGLIVGTGDHTGIEYDNCAIAGVAKQSDKHLPANYAPMIIACLSPTPFAQA